MHETPAEPTGLMVGSNDGVPVGYKVCSEGLKVGRNIVGYSVGKYVGISVGIAVGYSVGYSVGWYVLLPAQ